MANTISLKHSRQFFNGAGGILHDPVHEILHIYPLGALAAGYESIFFVFVPYGVDGLDFILGLLLYLMLSVKG